MGRASKRANEKKERVIKMKVLSSYEEDPKKALLVIIADGIDHGINVGGTLTEKDMILLSLTKGLLEYEESDSKEISTMAKRLFSELYKSVQYEVSDFNTLVRKTEEYIKNTYQ